MRGDAGIEASSGRTDGWRRWSIAVRPQRDDLRRRTDPLSVRE
jgi:hypothetical protein